MKNLDSPVNSLEAERIKREYVRRGREIPPDKYSWVHASNRFQYSRLWSNCIEALAMSDAYPLNGMRVLDVGCGRGSWLLEFVQCGASPSDVFGIDLVEQRVQAARAAVPAAEIHLGDATNLPWPDQHFDVVTQFTVFSSILDAGMRRDVAREMLRVLKPDGVILWYDLAMNNFRNPSVRGIPPWEITALFPECLAKSRRVTLAPPLSRFVTRYSWTLGSALESLPLLRTHRLALIRKRPADKPTGRAL